MSRAKLVRGAELSRVVRAEVLAAFVYRYTVENGYPKRNPLKMRLTALTDAEWLSERAFYVTAAGHLAKRPNHCEPVWMVETEQALLRGDAVVCEVESKEEQR